MFPGCSHLQHPLQSSSLFLRYNFQNMNFKYFLFWLPMIALAFANALLREMVFVNRFNEFRSHQLSTITLIAFCTIYIWIVWKYLAIQTARQAFLLGFFWMLLTIIFEFSIGRLTNKSWEFLLRNYDISSGHLWPIFLFSILIFPFIYFSLKSRNP